jgi:hypothetical protein
MNQGIDLKHSLQQQALQEWVLITLQVEPTETGKVTALNGTARLEPIKRWYITALTQSDSLR